MALASDKGGVRGVTLAISPMLNCETLCECFFRLVIDGDERREEVLVERLARALEVFSRARAAKERRLAREMEPMTEPWNVEGGMVGVGGEDEMEEGLILLLEM